MLQTLFYAFQTAVAIALPLILKAKFDKNKTAHKSCFGGGIIVYFIFNAVLNSIIQVLIIDSTSMTSPLRVNPWVSAIFSGVTLSVFLAVGRFVWIKFFMKKAKEKTDALVFGTGYAFAMSLVTYAVSGIVCTVFAVMKAIDSTKAVPAVFETTAKIVANSSAYTVFLVILQVALLCALEICISAIFFTSIKGLSNKALTIPVILASAVAHFFLETPLSIEIRTAILMAVTLLMAGLCWRCTQKD